jgi:hypothetical protein
MDYYQQFTFRKTVRETDMQLGWQEAFLYFLGNSNVEMISDSSAYSLLFKLDFHKREKKSPYFSMDSRGEMQNVTSVAIKVILLCEDDRIPGLPEDETYNGRWIWKYNSPITGKREIKHYEKMDLFRKEILSQRDASIQGIRVNNRNVPVVFFSSMYVPNSGDYRTIRSALHRGAKNTKTRSAIREILQKFDDVGRKKEVYFGILAMEYISPEYRTYCDIIKPIIYHDIKSLPGNEDIYKYDSVTLSTKSHRLRWMYNTTRYEIIRLAIDTGYSQGDYHTENMLVNEKRRRTIIIDFGKAVRIEKHEEIKDLWYGLLHSNFEDETKTEKYMKEICTRIYSETFVDRQPNADEFMWFKNIDAEDVQILVRIHRMREDQIHSRSNASFDMYFEKEKEYVFDGSCPINKNPLKWYQFPLDVFHKLIYNITY